MRRTKVDSCGPGAKVESKSDFNKRHNSDPDPSQKNSQLENDILPRMLTANTAVSPTDESLQKQLALMFLHIENQTNHFNSAL